MSHVVTVPELLDGHTVLDIECLDRVYLSGYVPTLQVGGQVFTFLHDHRGMPVASPAVFGQISGRFRQAVGRFAQMNDIPVVKFKKGIRKLDVMQRYLRAAARADRPGVAAIGRAEEFQLVWDARQRDSDPSRPPQFFFVKAERRVTCYYFYVFDERWGPGFIKVCAYFPYPVKVWVNGHEWAKRQLTRAGAGFTELSNGFAACDDPAGLQAICDRLGPAEIQAFFDRWLSRLPVPLTAADQAAGYWWELSMRQVETSRTMVFDAPRQARAFFEALIADNLDLGRPEHVEILFKRDPRGRKPKDQAGGTFRTAIDRNSQGVTINAFWRHSRVKQYLKDGRALRIETVVNSPDDLGCQRRLHNLPELQARARAINARLLETERVGQGCVFDSPAFARISQPTLTQDGRRAPATFRRPSSHGPGRHPRQHADRRHRHHEQEPARLDDRAARHRLQRQPGQLRPDPPVPQRHHHPHPAPQPVCPHPRRPALRDLLQQSPRPRPAPAHGRRPAPGPAPAPRRTARHRPRSHPAPRRSTTPGSRLTSPDARLIPRYPAGKLKTNVKVLGSKLG